MHSLKKENQTSPNLEVGSLKKWLIAIRPGTLVASISPVIMGTAIAYSDKSFHLLSALSAAISAIFIQIGTNLVNDYYDFMHGVDGPDRIGPTRVIQKGIIKPQHIKRAFIISFLIAVISGSYLVYRAGLPILIIGLLSIICGILYTAGPFPLAYIGLADPFVIIFFGPVAVGGAYYVQTLQIKDYVIIAGFGPGFLSNAILAINNLRDIYTDKKAGKKTLAVRLGDVFVRWEYLFSLFIAFGLPFIFTWMGHCCQILGCLAFLCIGPYIYTIWEKPGPIHNNLLIMTAATLFFYSILFSIGWIIM